MERLIDNPDCVEPGDTTWVLVASVFVLSMMPALAYFEAGLLRVTSTVSILIQIIGGAAILSVMWNLFGFTLVFGQSFLGIIGGFNHILMIDVPYDKCIKQAPHIPAALYAFFQMMFASIAPLLMTGAFAERLKFKAFVLLIITWEIFVYYPVAHWIWGDGWLKSVFGVQDFAGGIVIHATSGVSALICALVLGRRKNFDLYHGEFPPSNLPLAALGGSLLWTAWFGFNAGSALASNSLAVSTVVTTQRAAVFSCIVWLIISWIRHKPSAVAVINGVIAGLAGITPASGFINPVYGAILGIFFGVMSYLSILLLKNKLRIDDALDVSSVHGVTGILGAISIGFFGEKAFNKNGADGLFYGTNNGRLLGVQLLAVVVVCAWTAVVTYGLLVIIDLMVGLKIDQDSPISMDQLEHGENAYIWTNLIESRENAHVDLGIAAHSPIIDLSGSKDELIPLSTNNDNLLKQRSYSATREQ